MISVVSPFAIDELDIVFPKDESGVHLLVPERPIAVEVIEVVASVLEKYAKRLFLAPLAYEGWVVVASSYIGKAADVTQDFSELIRAFPGDGKGADASAADTANGMPLGVVGDVVVLTNCGDDLL